MTRFTFMNVSVALFCFFECMFYVVFCRLIFFHVWVKYLFFVFNLWSVWINLYEQHSIKCLWKSNDLRFTQHTAVARWCVNVLTGIRCVFDSVRVSVHDGVLLYHVIQRCTQWRIQMHQRWGNFRTNFSLLKNGKYLFFAHCLKWKKSVQTWQTATNQIFLEALTKDMIQYLSVNAVSFMLGKM